MAYGIIKIGEREVPMRATAATPIRYRQVFHKNLLPYFLGKADEEAMVEMVGELAYIMAKSAEGEDMTKLSEAGYVEWLEGFGAMDLMSAENATQILNFYQGASETHETVKKKSRPSEREMTISLYMLRCFQAGLHMSDLEQLNYGDVLDMFIEMSNDNVEYKTLATQEDFDRF